jgi:hypothetical protein
MRAFAPPSGYLSQREARNELLRRMYEGVAPSEKTKELQQEGYNVLDFAQATAAVETLRAAILSGKLGLYVELSSWKEYRPLSAEVCHAAGLPLGAIPVSKLESGAHLPASGLAGA